VDEWEAPAGDALAAREDHDGLRALRFIFVVRAIHGRPVIRARRRHLRELERLRRARRLQVQPLGAIRELFLVDTSRARRGLVLVIVATV
jgi:hypothetical protein